MFQVLSAFIFIILAAPLLVFGHSGGTADDGCHYCRTNCDKYGEQWNVRHCHGRSSFSPPAYVPSVVPYVAPSVDIVPDIQQDAPSFITAPSSRDILFPEFTETVPDIDLEDGLSDEDLDKLIDIQNDDQSAPSTSNAEEDLFTGIALSIMGIIGAGMFWLMNKGSK